MDTEKTWKTLKDPNTAEYKKRLTLSGAKNALCALLLFPLTLTLFITGGVYCAQDAVTLDAGVRADGENAGKSMTARKSRRDVPEDRAVYDAPEQTEARTSPETSAPETETAAPETEPEDTDDLYYFDRSAVPEGKSAIIPISLYKPITKDDLPVKNSSSLDVDWRECADLGLPVCYSEEEFRVLIIHTHGTEAYTDEGVFYTEKDEYMRSDDKSKSVVGIGDVFEKVFTDAGIKTVHCEIPIDKESYSKAYSNAASIIKKYLKEYPDIKLVLDIHRDSVDLSDGDKGKLVTKVNGKTAAQVMFVVGTDKLVSENKNWRYNFAFAIKLQFSLDEKYEGFVRPVNLKQGAYNQFYTPLSLLIEIGCDGNTYTEAEYAAYLTADQIVHTLKGS